MKKFKGIISLFFVACILFVVGCSDSESNTSSTESDTGNGTDGIMYIGMVNPPVLLNPINSTDVASQFVEKFMFDTFLEMEAAQTFTPKLAESFESDDNQTFTIKLHDDAKWTDGTPITAEDVAFTFNLVANPKTEVSVGAYIALFEGLDGTGKLAEGQTEIPSVTIVDEKTITFKTKSPVDVNMVKEQIGSKFMILPKHILKDVDPANLSKDPFFQNPNVTSGAFKFVQYKKDQYVEFVRNEDYYLGEPVLNKLFIKIVPGANMVAQLQTGEVHFNVSSGVGKIPAQDYETVEKMQNVEIKNEPTYGFQVMYVNVQNITDAKVRQALGYALNRQAIVDKLLKGYGEVIDSPYTSVSPYQDKTYGFTYDPEKAKKMLEEAGWDFNKTLNFVVPTGNVVREQSADLILQDLKAIGVKAEISKFDFPTLMQKGKAGEFDILLIGNNLTLDPEMSLHYASNGGLNYMKYSNPRVDDLLNQGIYEPDPEKRKVIYSELQKIWHEDSPIIYLYSDNDVSAISKEVIYGEPRVFGVHKDINKWAVNGAN